MHELILQIFRTRRPVLIRRKPRESLLVHEDAEGVDASHEDIDAEIELEPIDEIRLVHVALDHAAVVLDF